MARKAKCPEGEECPEWIFTFADLVMLMMGFFVILWVLKPNPGNPGAAKSAEESKADEKWVETVAKIREAFGYIPDPASTDPVAVHMLMKRAQAADPNMRSPDQSGDAKVPPDGPTGTDPLVTNVRPGTHVAVGGRLAFEPGAATLSPETLKVADEIIGRIRGHRNILQVKGHAARDDFPDGTPAQKFMDLSLRRAQAIADYFVASGISPDVVRVQGCSVHEPIVQRAYGEGAQALNRRVEVEVSNIPVPDRQDPARPAPKPAAPAEPKPNTPAAVEPAAHH